MSVDAAIVPKLDLDADVVRLTSQVCDIESVSRDEERLCDAIEDALRGLPHLDVTRLGNTLVARTGLGRGERALLAGHIDTVPLTDPPNLPTHIEDGDLVGRGTVDMKGGVAVQLKLAYAVRQPSRDLTFVFYDGEEIDTEFNGLLHLQRERPDLLAADFAVLLEPTTAIVEGGCKGTLRVEVTTHGVAAHSARPWKGRNAIHAASDVLSRLAAYEPRTVTVDGLDFHEALGATSISGGIAGNVIPDRCTVTVNYRYAPDKTPEEALDHVMELFDGFDIVVRDSAGGARPGMDLPAARDFVEALGVDVVAKQGWTDVARFAEMGVPAVNFGPGDPDLAHADDERCPLEQLRDAEAALLRWLA